MVHPQVLVYELFTFPGIEHTYNAITKRSAFKQTTRGRYVWCRVNPQPVGLALHMVVTGGLFWFSSTRKITANNVK